MFVCFGNDGDDFYFEFVGEGGKFIFGYVLKILWFLYLIKKRC